MGFILATLLWASYKGPQPSLLFSLVHAPPPFGSPLIEAFHPTTDMSGLSLQHGKTGHPELAFHFYLINSYSHFNFNYSPHLLELNNVLSILYLCFNGYIYLISRAL